jgi:hypothetical protein
LVLLLTGLAPLAQAQDDGEEEKLADLEGTVKNEGTGKPLNGANVLIQGTYKGTSTEEDGSFELEDIKPGDYTIKVKYLGFQTKVFNGVTLQPEETKTLQVRLKESAQNLKAVDVVGDNQLVKLESGQSQTNITQEEIQQSNATDVKDVVAMQKGVTKSPDGLRIRGGRRYETQYPRIRSPGRDSGWMLAQDPSRAWRSSPAG